MTRVLFCQRFVCWLTVLSVRLGGMVRRLLSFLLLGFLGLVQVSGQTSTQAPAVVAAAVMPADPNALMLLAARVNGLASADMKPWHLKANYQTFDDDGKPKDQGVFEEWWAGPDKYKISYSSASFNQVQYQDGSATFMSGDAKWPQLGEFLVEQYLVHPLPSATVIEKGKYIAKDTKVGAVTLQCLHAAPLPGSSVTSAFCFEKGLPALRIEASSLGMDVSFNDTVLADGRYVAKVIRVRSSGQTLLNLNLTSLNFPSKVEDADFVPPVTAVAAPPRMIPPGAMVLRKIAGDDVRYPATAKNQRIEGTVKLTATITNEGIVSDLRAISGNPILQQAAIDAVKTWHYEPYLVDDKPVDVETQVIVKFLLGR